jgi:hypothetical protein
MYNLNIIPETYQTMVPYPFIILEDFLEKNYALKNGYDFKVITEYLDKTIPMHSNRHPLDCMNQDRLILMSMMQQLDLFFYH